MDKFLKYIRVYLCPSVVQMRFLKEQTKKIKIFSLEAAEDRLYINFFKIVTVENAYSNVFCAHSLIIKCL